MTELRANERPDAWPHTPITFAHRGGAAHRRENTLDAFRHAEASGASGLESDVRMSADGVPMLVHDAVVRRGLRRTRIDRTPAADLAELGIPRLADLYEAVGIGLEVSLDVKVPDAGPAAIEVAVEAGATSRLWLCSPDLDELQGLRGRDGDVRLVHSTTRTAVRENLERHAAVLSQAGVAALNLHRTEWSQGLVVLFHRFDVLAFAWDVQEVRHLREVLAYGVDGVYSDHVDRMVAVVGEWRRDPE